MELTAKTVTLKTVEAPAPNKYGPTPSKPAPKTVTTEWIEPPNAGAARSAPERLVDSLVFWSGVGIEMPTRVQVAMVAGYKASSGRFRNLLGGLRTSGVVDYPQDGRVRLVTIPFDKRVLTKEQARTLVFEVLSPAQARMAKSIPVGEEVPRQFVADSNGYLLSSGRFRNLIGSLRTLNLFEYPSAGTVTHSKWAAELLR